MLMCFDVARRVSGNTTYVAALMAVMWIIAVHSVANSESFDIAEANWGISWVNAARLRIAAALMLLVFFAWLGVTIHRYSGKDWYQVYYQGVRSSPEALFGDQVREARRRFLGALVVNSPLLPSATSHPKY